MTNVDYTLASWLIDMLLHGHGTQFWLLSNYETLDSSQNCVLLLRRSMSIKQLGRVKSTSVTHKEGNICSIVLHKWIGVETVIVRNTSAREVLYQGYFILSGLHTL